MTVIYGCYLLLVCYMINYLTSYLEMLLLTMSKYSKNSGRV